jgi:sporulation related protein
MSIRKISVVLVSLSCLFFGCTMQDSGNVKKPAPSGLISTPVSYYSTAKAKYLATKYKENLDRIIEQVVRNPKTAPLQFANNIASVGGIGFFTHSATKTADERYLEVVLATPETFETKGDYSEKVQRLFSLYGFDLLRILSGDGELYQDGELTGYGLNLAWRNVVADPAGNRVILARAIIYLPKDKVRTYLRSEIKQNELLADAAIFGEEEDRPLTLVSYRPQDTRPDVRPAIREDNLAVTADSKPSQTPPSANAKLPPGLTNQLTETAKAESAKANDSVVEPIPSIEAELTKQESEVVLSLEPPKNDESKSSELAPLVGGDKSSSITSSATTDPKARLQSSRSATEKITESKVSAPNRPEKKTEIKESTNSRAKAPDSAMEKQAAAMTLKSSVLAEAAVNARIEEPQNKLPETVESSVVAQPTKVSSFEKAKVPVAEIPVAQVKPQVETPKTSELKKEVSEPVSVLPAKNTSVLSRNETDTILIPQMATKNDSVRQTSTRETSTISKAGAQPLATRKNEAVTSESAVYKPPAEQTASVRETAKAQVEAAKPKPEPTIAAATAVEKSLGVTAREVVSNTITKSSTKKVATNTDEKAALPVAPAKSMVERPVPDTKNAPSDTETPPSRGGRLQESVSLSPRAEPAQQAMPEAIVRDRKQDQAVQTEARTAAKPAEVSSPQTKTTPSAAAAPEASQKKQAPEQLALLRKPADVIVENKPAMRTLKALEGFVIQVAFNDKDKAQHWAEGMERRGYTVSITETGTEGALRVRLGNFVVRDDAERQLRTFKQEGLNGIIINLPQGFQPARSSVP